MNPSSKIWPIVSSSVVQQRQKWRYSKENKQIRWSSGSAVTAALGAIIVDVVTREWYILTTQTRDCNAFRASIRDLQIANPFTEASLTVDVSTQRLRLHSATSVGFDGRHSNAQYKCEMPQETTRWFIRGHFYVVEHWDELCVLCRNRKPWLISRHIERISCPSGRKWRSQMRRSQCLMLCIRHCFHSTIQIQMDKNAFNEKQSQHCFVLVLMI